MSLRIRHPRLLLLPFLNRLNMSKCSVVFRFGIIFLPRDAPQQLGDVSLRSVG